MRSTVVILLIAAVAGCATEYKPITSTFDTTAWWSPKRRFYVVVEPGKAECEVRQTGDRGVADWTAPAPGPDDEFVPADDGRRLVRICPVVTGPADMDKVALAFYDDGLLLAEYKVSDLVSDPRSLRFIDPDAGGKGGKRTWRLTTGRPEEGIVNRGRSFDVTTVESRLIRFDLATGRPERGLAARKNAKTEDSRKALAAANPQPVDFARGLTFAPQGLAADFTGNLYVVEGGGGFSRITADGRVLRIMEGVAGGPAAVAFAPDLSGRPGGGATFCLSTDLRVGQAFADGRTRVLADTFSGSRLLGPADVLYDNQGTLFFTDADPNATAGRSGSIYAISPDGQFLQVARDLDSPGGLAITGDGNELFVSERQLDRVLAFPILRKTGEALSLGRPRIVAKLPAGSKPVGLARDINGNLYAAASGTGRIEVVAPDGEPLAHLAAGGDSPSYIVFGTGKQDASTLFVSHADKAGNRIVRLDVGLVGQAKFFLPRVPLTPVGRVRAGGS